MAPQTITPSLSFVERLVLARRRTGLTQEGLAQAVGIMFTGKPCTVDIVKSWERGRTEPRPSELKRISEVTGQSADWLLGTGTSIDLTAPFPHAVEPIHSPITLPLPFADAA